MVFFFVGLILTVFLNGMLYLHVDKSADEIYGLHSRIIQRDVKYKDFLKHASELSKQETLRKRVHIVIGVSGLMCFTAGAISGIYHLA